MDRKFLTVTFLNLKFITVCMFVCTAAGHLALSKQCLIVSVSIPMHRYTSDSLLMIWSRVVM